MNNTPTPLTDKVVSSDMGDSGFIVDLIKHSQQLERELNSSKDWNTAAFAATSIASATIARLESELDQLKNDLAMAEGRHAAVMMHMQSVVDENTQLRKVCDALAHDLAIELEDPLIRFPEFKPRSLSDYNSLPHVVAKGETK